MNRTIRQMLAAALIPAAALLFATTSAHAAGMTSKHAENGVACATCHKSSADGKGAAFAAPDASTCLGCHKQDAIVKATEKLNFEAVLVDPKTKKEKRHTALINPHDSYHFGRTENCFDCHREHQKSTNACAGCHDTGAWKMGAPR